MSIADEPDRIVSYSVSVDLLHEARLVVLRRRSTHMGELEVRVCVERFVLEGVVDVEYTDEHPVPCHDIGIVPIQPEVFLLQFVHLSVDILCDVDVQPNERITRELVFYPLQAGQLDTALDRAVCKC
jgi:hypothetical protein